METLQRFRKSIPQGRFFHDEARKIIIDGSGNHFDPEIVRIFIDREDEF